jgi:hypothetical protein
MFPIHKEWAQQDRDFAERLAELAVVAGYWRGELNLYLKEANSTQVFEGLESIVRDIMHSLEEMASTDLMLGALDWQPDPPLQAALKLVRDEIGEEGAANLSRFLDQANKLGLELRESTASFSFRTQAWRQSGPNTPPQARSTIVFILQHKLRPVQLRFPSLGHWPQIAAFDHARFTDRLIDAGCLRSSGQFIYFDLTKHNSIPAFNRLLVILGDIVQAMEHTVATEGKKRMYIG